MRKYRRSRAPHGPPRCLGLTTDSIDTSILGVPYTLWYMDLEPTGWQCTDPQDVVGGPVVVVQLLGVLRHLQAVLLHHRHQVLPQP